MELLPQNLNINFFRCAIPAVVISAALTVISMLSWVHRGEEAFGLDFVGGTEIVVQFEKEVKVDDLRAALERSGFENVVIQAFEAADNRFSIRVKADAGKDTSAKLREVIATAAPDNKFTVDRDDYVGPVIGDELRTDSLIALGLSLVGIMIYIAFRFEWRFAVGAIAALFHDVIISAGMVALCNYQFTMGVIAALMTIIGYSVNDTIIIFDRVRENLTLREKDSAKKTGIASLSLREIMNLSLNQTLSRTLLTALTVFFVVVVLWLQGGPGLEDFAFTLVIGTIAGTYSTVFIACPTVMMFAQKAGTPAAARA